MAHPEPGGPEQGHQRWGHEREEHDVCLAGELHGMSGHLGACGEDRGAGRKGERDRSGRADGDGGVGGRGRVD